MDESFFRNRGGDGCSEVCSSPVSSQAATCPYPWDRVRASDLNSLLVELLLRSAMYWGLIENRELRKSSRRLVSLL